MGGKGSGRNKSMLNIYKGNSNKFTRPEGAGNFDNMDDYNIVQSTALRQGTIEHTPTNPKDIVNKAYADSLSPTESDPVWLAQSGGFLKTGEEAVELNEILDPTGDTAISMGSNDLKFQFSNPASDGFNIEGIGAFAGDLFHIHQHTGNPGAVNLMGMHAVDTDVTPMFIENAGGEIFKIDNSGNVESQANISGASMHVGPNAVLTSYTETDPVFLALSGAFLTAETDPIWLAQSGAFLKTADNDDGWLLQSGAWNTHVADNTQAHSDYLLNSGTDTAVGPLSMSGDQDASGAAMFRNILIGTEDTPGAASGWTQGTIYLQYTA